MNDVTEALTRHFATIVAGMLVSHGIASSDQASSIAGGIMAAVAVAWSIWQKREAVRKQNAHGADQYAKGHADGYFTATEGTPK